MSRPDPYFVQSVCNIPDLWGDTDAFVPGFALNIWAFCAELIVIAPIWGAYMVKNLGWRSVTFLWTEVIH